LSRRKAHHKCNYEGYKNKRGKYTYTSYFECFENGCDPEIILVENYPCSNKDELYARQRYYIENNECVNKGIPILSKDERKQKEKEYQKEYRKRIANTCKAGI
jgi:hypothetical protein